MASLAKLSMLALILALTFSSQIANADSAAMDCGYFWPIAGGVPDATTEGAFACREYDPRDPTLLVGPGTDFRIFYGAEWDRSLDPSQAAFLELVAEGFDASVRHYRGLRLEVDPVYFLVSSGDALIDPEDPLSGADTDTEAEAVGAWIDAFQPCPITTFSMALTTMAEVGDDNVKQMVAHEVFHCVQQFNFKAQDDASDSQWWSEGTAEFFGAAVFPCGNAEHGWSEDYDPDVSVLKQDYANVAFFQDLAQRSGGEHSILEFIRAMTPNDGEAEQQSALGRVVGIDHKFHQFGKDFVDDAIPDCGASGRMAIISDGGPMQEIGDNGTVEISVDPFTVWRKKIKLKKGRIYTIDLTSTGTGRINKRDLENPGEWEDVPDRLTVPCDEDVVLQLMATTTPASDTPYEVTLDFTSVDDPDTEGCEACVDTGHRDACIVGNWKAESSDVEVWLRQTLNSSGDSRSKIDVDSFNGGMSFAVSSEEKTIVGTLDGIQIKGRMIMQAGDSTFVSNFTFKGGGDSISSWSTERGGSRLYMCPETSTVAFSMTVTSEGGTMTIPIPVPDESSGAVEFEYRCDETSMTIIHRTPGLEDQVYRATRVR